MEKKKLLTVFIISIVLMVIIMGMVDSLVPNVRLTGLENTCPLLIPIIPELFTSDNPVSLSFAHYSGLDPVHEPLGVGGKNYLSSMFMSLAMLRSSLLCILSPLLKCV
jgi:hypothetical protein